MKKEHREILGELMGVCNNLGGRLDVTATHPKKFIERQEAHMLIYRLIYGLLGDVSENPYREEDVNQMNIALQKLKELTEKEYGDRYGRTEW